LARHRAKWRDIADSHATRGLAAPLRLSRLRSARVRSGDRALKILRRGARLGSCRSSFTYRNRFNVKMTYRFNFFRGEKTVGLPARLAQGKAATTITSTSIPGRQKSVVRQARTGGFAGSTHSFQTEL